MSIRSTYISSGILKTAAFIVLLAVGAAGQLDPDPNSPTPILLSAEGSTRALASPAGVPFEKIRRGDQEQAFRLGNKIDLYVADLELMKGEGANALRVYAEDSGGRQYRFPVLDLRVAKGKDEIYAVTILLKDDLGFWEQPREDGDVLLRLTWRGLSSNRVRLGIGKTGGEIKDDPASFPTPLSSLLSLSKVQKHEEPPTSEYVGYRWSGDRMRFLQQATFGATPEMDWRVRRIGLRAYLAEQFALPYPSTGNPYPNLPLKSTDAQNVTLGCGMFLPTSTLEYRICTRDHYSMYPVQNWFFIEALYGEPQLRHRVAWALSQVWVISGVDTQQGSWMIAYHKILSDHAIGNYRDLMRAMTLNPGMGNYLDMARSTANNPNENYARELMELFTIGLFMTNQDGTLILDQNGNPIPTYDQGTVDNLTKVLTGWTFCNQTCPNSAPGIVNYKDPLILNQNNHDTTSKTLLDYPNAVNRNIPAGLNGAVELELALDNIFHHPNVAPFVGTRLIQHLVTSDPTPAYVARISAVFNDNGFGVRGDLKAVVRAILLDPEARGDMKTDPNYGKLREPVQFATNFLKAFNVGSADLTQQSDGVLAGGMANLGQNPFNSPTVFNYYSPTYVVPGTSIIGPEFQLMTTGTAIARANVINQLVYNRVNVNLPNVPLGTAIDLTELEALAAADPTGNAILDHLNHKLLHGRMTPEMRAVILPAFTAVGAGNPRGRAQAALYLVATSSQFQIQR